MKLLFILPEYLPYSGGGIITFYRMLLPQLVAMGHEVSVIVGSGMFSEESRNPLVIDGVKVEALDRNLSEKYFQQFQSYASTPWLRRHLSAAWAMYEQAGNGENYDLVEATDWGLLFIPWAIRQSIPLVVRMHGSTGQIDIHDPVAGEELQGHLIRLMERQALAYANAVQTYSPANAAFWQQQTGRNVDCIYPAWQPLTKPQENIAPTDRGLVVGRLQRWKGPHVLCEAMQLLGDKAPVIDWMGRDTAFDSRQRRTSQHLAENYPTVWQKKMLHLQPEPPEQAAARQAAASFAVVPSTWDVFNFTCVEAMGQGTPVICSTGAGASCLIEDGVNGFKFENENPQALADALSRCVRMNSAQRSAMAKAAQATTGEVLNPKRIAEQHVHSYEAAIKNTAEKIRQDNWLHRACAPSKQSVARLAFLDHLPLKELMRYIWQRSKKKYLP